MTDERREYQRQWRKRNPDKVKSYIKNSVGKLKDRALADRRRYRAAHPEQCIIDSARDRAKRLELDFTITAKDIVIPKFCPILGIPIFSSKKKMTDNSPSLDRMNPNLGYTKGNIQVISQRANRIKNDGTADEHEKIAKHMRNYSVD